jgi:undecaprenyl-diphosphatase
MSEQAGKQQQTVADALAQRVEARQGTGSPWAEALRELGAVDRAVYQAVARTPTPALDRPFRRLSNAANYSRLWLGIAAAIALTGGKRGRRAALEGVLAVGVTSATINLGIKPLARRRRPDRADPAPHGARQVRMPESGSFPSGHAASAFAFAYAVGRHLPELAVPIRLLAAAVAYSRVHVGVHYPGDVVIGSVLGAGTAAMTAAACDRFPPSARLGLRLPRAQAPRPVLEIVIRADSGARQQDAARMPRRFQVMLVRSVLVLWRERIWPAGYARG